MSETKVKIKLNPTPETEKANDKKKHRRGVNIGSREDEILSRRRPSLINFYDLGQIKSGSSFVDLNFNIDTGTSVTILDVGLSSERPEFTFGDFTLSHWNSLVDKLLEVPLAEWKQNYKKIPYETGYKYGIAESNGRGGHLSDSATVSHANALYPNINPDWKPSGLKPIDDRISVASYGGLGLSFDMFDPSNYKFTKVRDFAATDATDFTVKQGADIFLIPQVCWNVMGQEVGVDAGFRRSLLIGNWSLISRQIWIEKTARRWFHPPYPEIPVFEGYYLNDTYQSTGAWMFDVDDIGDALALQISNQIKARAATTLYVQRGTFAGGGATFGYEPLGNFPFAASGSQSVVNVGFEWYTFADSGSFPDYLGGNRYEGAGLLTAIIKTPKGFYYAWRRNALSNPWINLGGSTSPES